MANIYTNAVVTIAARQSTDCHGSIFASRNMKEVDALPIKLSPTCPCDGCTVFAQLQRTRAYPFIRHSADHSGVLRAGLHSPGWTLQERPPPASPTLRPSEMAWERSRQVSCECRLSGSIPGQYLISRRAFVNPITTTSLHQSTTTSSTKLRATQPPSSTSTGTSSSSS